MLIVIMHGAAHVGANHHPHRLPAGPLRGQTGVVAVIGALAAVTILGSALLATPAASRKPTTQSQVASGTQSPAPAPMTMLGPQAAPRTQDLDRRLRETLASKAPTWQPRTRHILPDGRPKFSNRLLLESSPYLQQHAHNPVDWWPWSDEAFLAARARGVPVLLSVGYSTCHWCHVMEEESFEDEEIAGFLNQHYVAIKLDREERPDIDAVYMSAVQAMTGRGGWPMNVWLTHDRVPFYTGTYFPPRDGARGAGMGFLTLLARLSETWDKDHERVVNTAAKLLEAIRESARPAAPGGMPGTATLERAYKDAASSYDSLSGGRRGAPKFPATFPVRMLLRQHLRTGDKQALEMAAHTLEKMAAGGIYDQIGLGFHRYSTDDRWLVPHFEKMLYDNALLAVAYLEGWQATGSSGFARVARETLRWMERDMRSPEGGFYSATDADSLGPGGEREEGYYFTWTPAELLAALAATDAAEATRAWGVERGGNFEGRSILHLVKEPMPADAIREKLRSVRERRPAPLRDEKILASWNGLALSAFARAAVAFADPHAAAVAVTTAEFLMKNLWRDGRLMRSWKDGRARHAGLLDDHAFVAAGLVDLFEATGEPRWLAAAIDLDRVLASKFEDVKGGGFFSTASDSELLLTREKPGDDGAEPSGNAVHALTLLRLHLMTGQDAYRERAERIFKAFGKQLEQQPAAMSEMLIAADFALADTREIVLVATKSASELLPLQQKFGARFLPSRVLVQTVEGPALSALAKLTPLVTGKIAQRGKATAYVCRHGACELPVVEADAFAAQLAGSGARTESTAGPAAPAQQSH